MVGGKMKEGSRSMTESSVLALHDSNMSVADTVVRLTELNKAAASLSGKNGLWTQKNQFELWLPTYYQCDLGLNT